MPHGLLVGLVVAAASLSLGAVGSPSPKVQISPPSTFTAPQPTPVPVVVVSQPEKSWLSVDGVVALATLGAVMVALAVGLMGLFSSELREMAGLRPKLYAQFSSQAPDAVRVMTGVRDAVTGRLLEMFPTYYVRLRIRNVGRVRADNVQVSAVKIQKYDHDERGYVDDESTLPLNLTWANVGGTTIPSINRGMIRHCDLCHTQQRWPDLPTYQPDWPPVFRLNTEVTPNPIGEDEIPPTMKRAGKYRLTIVLSANNASPRYQDVIIDFSGQWSDDAREMLDTELVIAVQPGSATAEM